jgi:hypothetical protein
MLTSCGSRRNIVRPALAHSAVHRAGVRGTGGVVLGLYLIADNLLPYLLDGRRGRRGARRPHRRYFSGASRFAAVEDRRRPDYETTAVGPAEPGAARGRRPSARCRSGVFALPARRRVGVLTPAAGARAGEPGSEDEARRCGGVVLRRVLRDARVRARPRVGTLEMGRILLEIGSAGARVPALLPVLDSRPIRRRRRGWRAKRSPRSQSPEAARFKPTQDYVLGSGWWTKHGAPGTAWPLSAAAKPARHRGYARDTRAARRGISTRSI